MNKQLAFLVSLIILLLANLARAEEVTSGFCTQLQLEQIPVTDIAEGWATPMNTMRITQEYNNSYDEGWCSVGNAQPPATSGACKNRKIYYGHDGIDIHKSGAKAGQEAVYSIADGIVIASHASGNFSGWGETMIIATRANQFSEELITVHYHHLYQVPPDMTTSRLYSPCQRVNQGEQIALEGGTPNWPTHLHFAVKRWSNLAYLQNLISQNPWGLYGSGYVYDQTEKLNCFLAPERVLVRDFSEFLGAKKDAYRDWQWASPYITKVVYKGWFLGNFDGSYGVDTDVPRREIARLLKVALKLPTIRQDTYPAFWDLPNDDQDFPYVNTLINQNFSVSIINPEGSCRTDGSYFCPDRPATRAEAIKMIVAGFFQQEFLELYNNWVWRAAEPMVKNLLSIYTDVDPEAWHAPYIFFAWNQGLLTEQELFEPNRPIKRAELAKWLVLSHNPQNTPTDSTDFCSLVSCEQGYVCDAASKNCIPLPHCLPDENTICPLGGGYQSPSDPLNDQDAGDSPTTSADSGTDNQSTEPDAGTNPTDAGITQPENPADASTINQSDANSIPPETQADASTSSGNQPDAGSVTPTCVRHYYVGPMSASCLTNLQASGAPRLCLETAGPNGSTLNWRLCKQFEDFQYQLDYRLLDQSRNQTLSANYTAGPSGNCTPWQTSNFSYLKTEGVSSGAKIQVEVHSPSGCTFPSCTYLSGEKTVYFDCQ